MKDVTVNLASWAAMMLLLLATYLCSLVLTGTLASFANLSIAAAKAALIYWFFMQGRRETGLVRLAALVGGVWLAVLFLLTFCDYVTRAWI